MHIVELGLTLLAKAGLPLKYWWDSFVSAVFIINRLPTPSLDQATPYYLLFQQAPYYSFFKTFGCSCYPYFVLTIEISFSSEVPSVYFLGTALTTVGIVVCILQAGYTLLYIALFFFLYLGLSWFLLQIQHVCFLSPLLFLSCILLMILDLAYLKTLLMLHNLQL